MRKTSPILSSRALFALFALLVFAILAVPIFAYAQLNNTNTTNSQRIGVKITSPKVNQTVPIGELTVNGTSSDSPQTNCQVFVDLNDTKPMQNVTGVGLGGPKDYSNWTFTYTQNYHLIDKGLNELTSKISCYDNLGAGNVTTKYYSINITGTDNPTSFIPSTGNLSVNNSTTGFQSIAYSTVLPQYSTIDTNNSKSLDENVINNSESLVYEPTGNVYSGNNDNSNDIMTIVMTITTITIEGHRQTPVILSMTMILIQIIIMITVTTRTRTVRKLNPILQSIQKR